MSLAWAETACESGCVSQCLSVSCRRVLQRCAQLPRAAAVGPPPSVAKERHLAVAGALWANLFPFLRSSRLSQTPPAQLADSAAGERNPPGAGLHPQGAVNVRCGVGVPALPSAADSATRLVLSRLLPEFKGPR